MNPNLEQVYHERDDDCIYVEPGKSAVSALCGVISMSEEKFVIAMEELLCRYFRGISCTNISKIVMWFVPLVTTVDASVINESTVDYELSVKLYTNYFPNYIMTIRICKAVPGYTTFSVATKHNDFVVKYGNNLCLHDVSELFILEVGYLIYCCEE
jgi:hypothetical protein